MLGHFEYKFEFLKNTFNDKRNLTNFIIFSANKSTTPMCR